MYTALIVVAFVFFAAGGGSFLYLNFHKKNKKLGIFVSAALTAVGGFILILNAAIHPDSIQVPEVEIPVITAPEVNVPSHTR